MERFKRYHVYMHKDCCSKVKFLKSKFFSVICWCWCWDTTAVCSIHYMYVCKDIYKHLLITSNQQQEPIRLFIKQNKKISRFLKRVCSTRFLTGYMYFNRIIYVFRFQFIKILLEMFQRTSILRECIFSAVVCGAWDWSNRQIGKPNSSTCLSKSYHN